ncbi:MAG: hypothetical protein B7Y74_16835, partial [Novosphingobium sp. 35-62-5]
MRHADNGDVVSLREDQPRFQDRAELPSVIEIDPPQLLPRQVAGHRVNDEHGERVAHIARLRQALAHRLQIVLHGE